MDPRSSRRAVPHRAVRRPLVALVVTAPLLLAGCSNLGTHGTHDPGLPAFTTQPAAAGNSGAAIPAGTSVQTFTAPDGTAVQYVLVVPPGRSAGQPGKVVIAFPPGEQDLAVTKQVVAQTWQAEAAKRDWVVVSPVATAKGLYSQAPGADLVPALLGSIQSKFPPENGKFDLAGVSNGGVSAFRAAIGQPQRFRSLVVFPGTPPTGADPALTSLTGIGAAFFVGAKDTEWLGGSNTAATALRKIGNRVKFVEVPDQGHLLSITGADLFQAMEQVRG